MSKMVWINWEDSHRVSRVKSTVHSTVSIRRSWTEQFEVPRQMLPQHFKNSINSNESASPHFIFPSVVKNKEFVLIRAKKLFFTKVGFSRFLLGNRENLAFATTSNSLHFSAKMPGWLSTLKDIVTELAGEAWRGIAGWRLSDFSPSTNDDLRSAQPYLSS